MSDLAVRATTTSPRHDVLGHASGLDGSLTRVDCGEDGDFADPSRDLLDAVPAIGVGIHAGHRDAATWRSFLPGQFDYIAHAWVEPIRLTSASRSTSPSSS